MSQFLDPSIMTLPKLLQQAGYATAHVGKWHLGKEPQSRKSLIEYGFAEARWVDARSDLQSEAETTATQTNLWSIDRRPQASRVLVDATLEVLRQIKNKPFYCQLWLNIRIVHSRLRERSELRFAREWVRRERVSQNLSSRTPLSK